MTSGKIMCTLAALLCLLLAVTSAPASEADLEEKRAANPAAAAGHYAPVPFPDELMGTWVADDPNYIEPNGWDDWYRSIDIGYWDDGSLGIQYGSLVGSVVLSADYDGVTYIVAVRTEFDEFTSYFFRLSQGGLMVKAPGILFNEPDRYKAYHRFIDEWAEEEEWP